jgi:hypothetical protein
MPKAILTFHLPKEEIEYLDAMHGSEWKGIVNLVDVYLRNALKYGHTYKNAKEALEAVKKELWDLCQERNLDPWQ